jgi:hypothetical protein
MSGDVTLKGITGGALVEAMNGDINVDVKALAASRPLSFTSMRGEISIHVPGDSKANVRFRTHRGVILTNFDDKALVTKTEISHVASHKAHKDGDPDAPQPPVKSVDAVSPSVTGASSADSDGDWHAEVRDSIREAAIDAADAARDAADAVHEGLQEMHAEFTGVVVPLPPMTGGKVVSGVLNGGGVEIQAATLNGDITLKKGE